MKDTFILFYETCIKPLCDAINRVADSLGGVHPAAPQSPVIETTVEKSAAEPKRTRGPSKPKEAPPAQSEPLAAKGELNGDFDHDFKVIQSYVVPLVQAGRKQDILNHLQSLGVERVAELEVDRLPALLEFLKGLGEETV